MPRLGLRKIYPSIMDKITAITVSFTPFSRLEIVEEEKTIKEHGIRIPMDFLLSLERISQERS